MTFRPTVERMVRSDARNLSLCQLAVLLILRDDPKVNCTIRGIAAHLNVSKPAITRAADRLHDLGFVTREVDRSDRRSLFLCLTPGGWLFATSLPNDADVRAVA